MRVQTEIRRDGDGSTHMKRIAYDQDAIELPRPQQRTRLSGIEPMILAA